jgi:hypothetical protein
MKKTKFAIGCLIQWYEVEIVHEYLNSLRDAIDNYDKSNVLIDITVSVDQTLEKADGDVCNISQKIFDSIHRLYGADFNIKWNEINTLYTIADYRREFNDNYCTLADVLIWGETDMLVPKQMFSALDILHQSQKDISPKYLATFGICKMWDASWEPLEHIEFTDKPFIENDYTNWWSLKYTMTIDEMNSFNDRVDQLDVRTVTPHKFNGCGLVISSEVIKSGVNIPRSIFFVHEDSSFMIMTNKLLGDIPQYHFKNILIVHNRNHLRKRMYVQNESGTSLNEKRRSNEWYVKANKYSEQNCYNIFNPNYKSLTWNDIL